MLRNFLGYDDSKEKIDFADKKQLAGILFKNIKIAPAIGGALPPKILDEPDKKIIRKAEKRKLKRYNLSQTATILNVPRQSLYY
jgi:hypothetical protein